MFGLFMSNGEQDNENSDGIEISLIVYIQSTGLETVQATTIRGFIRIAGIYYHTMCN